jgi:hypothetical protein
LFAAHPTCLHYYRPTASLCELHICAILIYSLSQLRWRHLDVFVICRNRNLNFCVVESHEKHFFEKLTNCDLANKAMIYAYWRWWYLKKLSENNMMFTPYTYLPSFNAKFALWFLEKSCIFDFQFWIKWRKTERTYKKTNKKNK